MANTGNSDKWYFTKEQLENTPSRKCGFDDYKELQYRQQAANFIQDMGQRLKVSQLCINTAIVYMHRFYVFHSFTNFPWHQMAAAALFLAAKVEEQPRKLEYVIRVANICKNPRDSSFDINSERYIAQSQDLVFNENVLLQTLGFDVAIDHPHTYVVRCCHLVRASKDLAQTSYFMASNSLHLTTMCIQYKPTVVACFCILLACKWSNWEIPLSNEKKEWYTYVDPTVTAELLQQLTSEFLVIFENCPSRLKEKIMAKQESSGSPFEQDRKPETSSQRALEFKGDDPHKHRSRPHEASASGHRSQEQREREYKERKEKERIAHMSGITLPHQSHHHRPERPPPIDLKMKLHSRQPSGSQPYPPNARAEPRDILREAAKDSPFGLPTVRDPIREQAKDPYAARSDKELPKRDPLLKPNVQTDPNSLTNYSDVRQQRIDPSRSRIDPSKSASKQDMMRRYEEQKPHIKTETDNIKKHLSSSFDKNSAYLKPSSSTSQKIKSPFSLDNKSVPKTSSSQAAGPPKAQFNGSYNKPPPQETEVKIKTEPLSVKEEIPTPAFIKRPSLFSPEKTPPQVKLEIKSEPLSQTFSSSLSNLSALSPINSPPSVPSMRNRNYSSSSEPELRPTMKKIDQVEGFENLMRDSTIGMANISSVTDTIQDSMSPPLTETERINPGKDSSQNPLANGLETNPTLISNLLKEAASTSHLPGVVTNSIKTEPVEPGSLLVPPPEHKEKEHHHHKSKKKKEKHKHRDKDKHREEKEKKKKHKDKDREKHKHKERKDVVEPRPMMSEPIKITIQRDKIQPLSEGLKIKIPKDKIKTDGIGDPLPQQSSGGLKIKIPKEMITNCNRSSGHSMSSMDMSMGGGSGSSRKRDRDRSSPAETPPLKISKSSHRESKQNGRHSYNKVSKNPPSSSENVANNAQVDSSLSDSMAVSEKKPNEEPILQIINNVPVEQNNNEKLVKDLAQSTSSLKEPSSPKHVSSTVEMISPTPLSPILSPISPIRESDPRIDNILIPLSPISANNTPPFEQEMHISDISNTSSFHPENFFSSSQLSIDRGNALTSFPKASNTIGGEFRSNTPPGYPTNTFLSYEENHNNSLQIRSSPPSYTSKSPPPYHQKHATSQWQSRSSTSPGYQTAQPINNSMEGRKPPPYNSNPYKLLNHHSPYERSNSSQFQRQHRNSENYDNYEYSPYNPPPPSYQSKSHRPYNPPPRYPSRVSSNHQPPPPPQTVNTYDFPPLQQSQQDTQIHYTTAPPQLSYNAYQVVAPTMPNLNVPPPSYGMYTNFFGGYMYSDMYQQPVSSGFGGVGQPPLPMDAPPSEVPPPPPPE